MTSIDLRLTNEAIERLKQDMEILEFDDPIVSVVWWNGGVMVANNPDGKEVSKEEPPHWGVGWYKPEQVAPNLIQVIEGIKFVFDQGDISERLNGKTLDVKGLHYTVTD